MDVRVECYAGHRAEQEPRALWIDGRRLRVLGVGKRWIEPQGRYWLVRTEDGHQVLLRYEEQQDRWSLVRRSVAQA